MSFLSGLGDVFHAIGHFVSGGDSNANAGTSFDDQQDQQRRQQQQSQAPQQSSQPQQSGDNNNPVTNNTINLSPLEKAGNNNSNNPSSLTNYSQAPHPQASSLAKAPANNDNSGMAGAQDNTPNNNNGGFWHEVTHNPVTNVVGGVAKAAAAPFEYLGKTDIIDPARELVDQATGNQAAYNQEMANNNVDLGLSQRNPDGSITGNSLKGGLEKWAGNSAGALLTVAAPGADNLIKDGVGNIISDTALPGVVKSQLPKFVAGGTIGGAFNDANTVANGDTNPGDLAKSFGQGFAVGGTAGVALPAIASGLKKVTGFGADNASADASQVAPGIKSANPDLNNGGGVIEPTDNTPAYQRGTPTTVGEAQGQHAIGVNNIPDEAFNADARVAQQDTPSPLDVPTYMRNSAESQLEDANNRIAQADQQMSLINNAPNDQVRAFNGKQAIADAYKDSPTKGQATAALVKARQGAVGDPTDALPQIMAERAKAVSDANAAKAAIAARDQLSLGGVIKDEITNPATIAEGSTVAGTVAKEAVDEAHIAAEQKAQAAAQAAQNQPLPTVEFNEGPSVSPGTLPPDTVNASPTAAVTRGGTAPAVVNAAPTALIKPLDQAGSVPGAVAERPAPTVQTPAEAAAAQQPVQVAEPQAPATVDTAPQTQAPTPAEQVQAAAAQEASQAPTPLIEQALDDSKRQAQNAPNIRAALNQKLDTESQIAGDPTLRNVLSNQALNQAGEQAVAQTPVEELLNKYSGVPNLHTPADLAYGRASLIKLTSVLKDGTPEEQDAARQAMANIAEGLEKGISNGGRVTNYTQGLVDSLPRQAKIPFVITKLDRIREAGGMPLIKDNLPLQNEITAKLDNLFAQQENLKAGVAGLEDRANQAALDAEHGIPNDTSGLHGQLAQARTALQAANGEIEKYYTQLVPGSSVGQKLNSLQRTAMLTSPTGRANTGIFAGFNTLHQGLQDVTQGLLAKGINFVKPGAALDTLRGGSRVVTGAGRGLVKTGNEIKGAQYTNDTLGSIRQGGVDGMSNLKNGSKANFFPRTTQLVKTLTHAPSNLTEGVQDQRLYQLAVQEGQQRGLTGDMLKQYADGRAETASPQMADNANQLHASINHMNNNPITKVLDGISRAIGETKSDATDSLGAKTGHFVLGAVKNQVLPFTRFIGGNMWNSITDKNVVASTLKLGMSAAKGDVNGIVENLAKTANNVAYTYALGYTLTKSGVITNTDANGYNSGGAYLHVGSHFIPVNDLGFFSPSLILGNALYQGLNSKGSAVDQFGKTLGASLVNGFKSVGGTSLSTDNNGMKAISTLTGNGKTPGSASNAGAQFAGGFAGQYIPAATNDVNAVLNNYTALNPTHEAAQTKVTKGSEGIDTANGNPSTAKDVGASEVNSLINKIPVASQLALPRNASEAAPDIADRLARGSHIGAPQAAALQKAADQKTSVQNDIANGIPVYQPAKGMAPKGYNFDNTFNTDVQTGKFDKAITGLNSELKVMNTPGPEHIPPSQKQDVQDKITQLQVAQKAKLGYSDMQLYNNTSVSNWRDMGNPDSEKYDPATYQKLWGIDQALAQANVAGHFSVDAKNSDSSKLSGTQKYSLSTKGGRGGSSAASKLVKDNTIGSVAAIPNEDFTTNLKATPISARIPQIALTKPDTLIKAHKISVASPRA